MAYRSSDDVLRERAAELDADVAAADERIASLRGELDTIERATKHLEARLREAGPAAGPRGVVRDRVGLAGILLAVAAAVPAPLHIFWHRWVGRDNTVVPAILMLATPAILAALVTWPYRHLSAPCRWASRAGLLLAIAPFANVLIALLRRAW